MTFVGHARQGQTEGCAADMAGILCAGTDLRLL
ncbi:hypothetical protein PSYJA_31776, partial [Pseudomonas syringae pv. japonica str. M301072]